jgi:hypothetical protein
MILANTNLDVGDSQTQLTPILSCKTSRRLTPLRRKRTHYRKSKSKRTQRLYGRERLLNGWQSLAVFDSVHLCHLSRQPHPSLWQKRLRTRVGTQTMLGILLQKARNTRMRLHAGGELLPKLLPWVDEGWGWGCLVLPHPLLLFTRQRRKT